METMQLFDTRSRKLEQVSPKGDEPLGFYCCGPTVYGPAHIGNFRTFLVQDLFRRVAEASGMQLKHVRNLTDVDDKTIRGARESGVSLGEFTRAWTEKFHADCSALNLLVPTVEPSAVEHLPQQIEMIEKLVEGGHAYAAKDGSVYFRIASFEKYGELSGLETRELELGKTQNQRANNADEYEKDSLADFVLWKARREEDGENYWDSPWGQGRPGWHLECSAMIAEHLGDSFDVHSGGVDLVFPHHENEIAQSKCACGGEFARHWFHVSHLMVDGAKMSKSLGNLYTIEQLEEEGFSPMEVRFALLAGHYRKQLNFTFDSLRDARLNLIRLSELENSLVELAADSSSEGWGPFAEVIESLRKDLNAPTALGKLFSALAPIEKAINAGSLSQSAAAEALAGLRLVVSTFGWTLPELEVSEIPSEIRDLAEARLAAKASKDWARSDELRDEILAKGWVVKDAKDGYELEPKI